MAEIIITAVISVFFVIGVYTTVKEMWSLLTDSDKKNPRNTVTGAFKSVITLCLFRPFQEHPSAMRRVQQHLVFPTEL